MHILEWNKNISDVKNNHFQNLSQNIDSQSKSSGNHLQREAFDGFHKCKKNYWKAVFR